MRVHELGDRADLAGGDDTDRLRVLALDAQHLADALLLAALGVPDVVVRRDLAASRRGSRSAGRRTGRPSS